MNNASLKIKLVFYCSVLLVLALVSYKIYLNFFEQDFEAVHSVQVERIEDVISDSPSYSFAVVGNINNSVGIFERKIIPMLNRSDVDFVVSAGNAVSTGGEDKYRALYRTLSRLDHPYLLTFGENEESRLGSFRFYDHFGPYLFSFSAGNSRFIFLDSTGKTNYLWQLRWLEEQLTDANGKQVFVFSGRPFKPVSKEGFFDFDRDYLFAERDDLLAKELRHDFETLMEEAAVDAVFSANLPLFSDQLHNDTRYVLTGGAGGFVPDSDNGYYHFVEVVVDGSDIQISPKRLDIAQHQVWRTLESLWFFTHSLFYVGYLNFLLIVGLLLLISSWLYQKIFIKRDYYPSFDLDLAPFLNRSLRVAMFTNNYLPFIGGVPISIDRLCKGLIQLGQEVLVVAPGYAKSVDGETDTFRVGSLLPFGKNSEFRLANIFSPALYWRVIRYRPDIIHVHHPFWLGSVGVFLARRLRIPVIYTYHTRLEHYAHYVPLPGPLFRNLVSHALVRRFANLCDGVIVPTESAEEYLRTIGVKRPIHVQPTGIDYDGFQGISEQATERLRTRLRLETDNVLISISRLSKEKNIDFMLDSIHELLQRCTIPFKLLIIGGGPEHDRLQGRIMDEGLEDRVMLVGPVPPEEIPTYCQLGKFFLFASRSETQGMVILEAMAAGLPVIAVRSSGIDDIIQEGFNGFKTPLNTSLWSECVERLLADPEECRALGINARTFAKDYGIVEFSSSIRHFYSYILASLAKKHSEPHTTSPQSAE